MTDYPLDTATRLARNADGSFASSGGAAYWNFQSAFGGWALALALEAVQAEGPRAGLLASATAHFMKPLPEAGLALTVQTLREGRRTDTCCAPAPSSRRWGATTCWSRPTHRAWRAGASRRV